MVILVQIKAHCEQLCLDLRGLLKYGRSGPVCDVAMHPVLMWTSLQWWAHNFTFRITNTRVDPHQRTSYGGYGQLRVHRPRLLVCT